MGPLTRGMDGPLLEADRGQVSLITLRDEVIRQFRFHDPSKNLPFYKRGEQSGNEGALLDDERGSTRV